MDDYVGSGVPSYYQYRFYVKSVILHEGVTAIGANNFWNFEHLQEITLPQSLTAIGNYAFKGCGQLQEIVLPDQLLTIGSYAFGACYNLTQITIPGSVSSIGGKAFHECRLLEKIEVVSENETYASEQGVLYDKEKRQLMLVPPNYPDSTLIVPDTVAAMDTHAIYYCSTLKYLVFKGGPPTGFNSFWQKLDLVMIYFNSSWESWGSLKSSWEDRNIIWVDTINLDGQQDLTIQADSTQLEVGGSMQLSAVLDPSLAVEFSWGSDDEEVAVVSDTGYVNAVGPGTANIKAESADGRYSSSIVITVIGDEFLMPSYDLSTLEKELNYTYVYRPTKQIVSEKLHGVYFLNGKELGFYSLLNKTYRNVQIFDGETNSYSGCTDAYTDNKKLYVLSGDICYIYDLDTQCMLSHFAITGLQGGAIGADDQGRIYVGGSVTGYSGKYRISLFSQDGQRLSDLTMGIDIDSFSGFDASNGYFYMETEYDYYSWGYSRPGKGLTMGKVDGNRLYYIETFNSFLESGIISREMGCLEYLCQSSYLNHQTGAALLGGKYLVSTSASMGRLLVFDSSSASEEGINSLLKVARSALEGNEEDYYTDLASIGVRAVYNEKHDSMIVYENGNILSEYDLSTGEKIAVGKTAHRVFNLLQMGDSLVVIEKEEDSYYMGILDWGDLEQIEIQAKDTVMKVGDTQQLALVGNDKHYELIPKWSSSDSSILTVSQSGKLAAWKEGEVTITAKVADTVSSSVTVRVTADGLLVPQANVIAKTGAKSNNYSDNNYSVYGKVVNSYFAENEDQTLARVEYIPDIGVQIENYSSGYELLSAQVLAAELPYFGGFYAGKDANFLVFGQKNESETDSTEVMRIVKYSKDWQRQGQASVRGANTYIPFDAGSLRMAETGDGRLYIHTCHEMYENPDDGLHHQSNMTYVLNEESMEIEQSYYDVLNISQAGYVSHSFNQFVQTDDQYVFRVDHGDSWPTRAVTLTRCDVGGKITNVDYVLPFSITIFGDNNVNYNDTGVSVGGLELSDNFCLIAGNSVDQTKSSTSGARNIFLSVTAKSLTSTRTVWLTDYAFNSKITARTPHIVKLNEEQFLILWEEYNSSTKATSVKMVTVDGEGNLTSETVDTKLRLSDCKPIMASDGLVKWYVTENEKIMFCELNPYRLEDIKGEIKIETDPESGTETNPESGTGAGTPNQTKFTPALKTGNILLQKGKSYKLTTNSKNVKITKVKIVGAKGKKLVKVTSSGKITAKNKTGTAKVKVTYKYAGKSTTKTVKVKVQKNVVCILSKKNTTVKLKKNTKCNIVNPANMLSSSGMRNFKSSNKKVAAVTQKGVVKAKKKGNAKITVALNKVKYTVTVKVK